MITPQEKNITLGFYFGVLYNILESIFVFIKSGSSPQGHTVFPGEEGSLQRRGGIFSVCVCCVLCVCVCCVCAVCVCAVRVCERDC